MDRYEKIFMVASGVVAVVGLIVGIILLCMYGNTPVKDLPTWLWWLLK